MTDTIEFIKFRLQNFDVIGEPLFADYYINEVINKNSIEKVVWKGLVGQMIGIPPMAMMLLDSGYLGRIEILGFTKTHCFRGSYKRVFLDKEKNGFRISSWVFEQMKENHSTFEVVKEKVYELNNISVEFVQGVFLFYEGGDLDSISINNSESFPKEKVKTLDEYFPQLKDITLPSTLELLNDHSLLTQDFIKRICRHEKYLQALASVVVAGKKIREWKELSADWSVDFSKIISAEEKSLTNGGIGCLSVFVVGFLVSSYFTYVLYKEDKELPLLLTMVTTILLVLILFLMYGMLFIKDKNR